MSVNVTIPANAGDPWSCTVNGTKYTYKAGTVAAVPESVAAVIAGLGAYPPEEEKALPSIGMAGQTLPGLVRQGAAVADAAGDAPTAEEFKALLDSLRGAGVIGV